ncbi:hypothetical protein E3O47_09485 [Cryobacterium sp. TMT2-17-1]|uniref:Uncharacterized protein n=1 Tax=Cryobacterium sandaracinum TaxID=1259247 RepID=A0ABY2JFS2_9MICO|nr:hypothetical protein E3N94_16130 [Cryobacterium sp. Sr3]TFC49906.1 hypothetical protein E3O47_09485 [Cryobacterium sp. TMT2-17-1]TFD03324.1 hypothetical protein E3T25_06845 [Cryobacterium sandaracinum]
MPLFSDPNGAGLRPDIDTASTRLRPGCGPRGGRRNAAAAGRCPGRSRPARNGLDTHQRFSMMFCV